MKLSNWARWQLDYLGSTVEEAQAVLGVKPDGIIGPKTLRALWLRAKPDTATIVKRARLAIFWPDVTYRLGKGGWRWLPDGPDPEPECDCSGFVAHVLGLPRDQADETVGGPSWVETTALVRDGRGPQRLVRALPLADAQPGDLVCYGDSGGQGHVGIVVERNGARIITVDCSASGDKTGSAIQRRDRTALWKSKGAVTLRLVGGAE